MRVCADVYTLRYFLRAKILLCFNESLSEMTCSASFLMIHPVALNNTV